MNDQPSTFYLSRTCPIDNWRIVMTQPTDGEWIELDVQFYGQATAERDKRNGKGNEAQGVLEI